MALWSIILQQLGACILYVQIIASVIDPSATFSASNSSVGLDDLACFSAVQGLAISPM